MVDKQRIVRVETASGTIERHHACSPTLVRLMKRIGLLLALLLVLPLGCKKKDVKTISIDGSSTVYPITEAVAEEFAAARRSSGEGNVRVTIGVSGTGGGFEKFCRGDSDITGASRPIKPTELEACEAAGIEFLELPVAYDGITVVVNPANDWVDQLTTEELRKIWEPSAQRTIMNWNQVRDGWPDRPMTLYGAGVDSGTYDYFTKAVSGEEGKSRGDFTSSEDDNVLVQGVSGDENALGFFGFAYFDENRDKLKAIPIVHDGGAPVSPTLETIASSTYQPLSRPIFIYVSKSSLERPEVEDFLTFYLTEGRPLVEEVGYIPMPDRAYELALHRMEERVTGSVFDGQGSTVGVSVQDLLTREGGGTPAEPDESGAPAVPAGTTDNDGVGAEGTEAVDAQAVPTEETDAAEPIQPDAQER